MATHSSILAWRIPWTEPWWATVHGVTRVGHDLVTKPPPRTFIHDYSTFMGNNLQTFITLSNWKSHNISQPDNIETNCGILIQWK